MEMMGLTMNGQLSPTSVLLADVSALGSQGPNSTALVTHDMPPVALLGALPGLRSVGV